MKRYYAMKWAKYLEQPGLKQARHILIDRKAKKVTKSTPKCCLGHLEFMLGTKFEKKTGACMSDSRPVWVAKDTSSYAVVSPETQNKLDMKSSCGGTSLSVLPGAITEWDNLAEANDGGLSLKEIAKIIRKHWKEI